MPPSPGKIHSLPVKVLYNIDTSSQSYLTVLNDKQDVYIHPGSPGYSSEREGPVASCTLKTVARGICFASPECIPNSTSLDFSIYNLDPTIHRPSSARAFPSSPAIEHHPPSSSSSSTSSWTGKGFLSWVLSEPGIGTTLIKGRIVREYEFSSIHFAPEGGLEGLMALANSNSGSIEDSDGKGWGIEIGISLRQLNPDNKIEFQSRKEFEEMLQKGKSNSTSNSSLPSNSSPIRPQTGGNTPIVSSPLINGITRFENGNRTPNVNSTPQIAGPSASSTATVRPNIIQPTPVPASIQQSAGQSSRRPSSLTHRPSSSSMPPSSLPPLPSSSNMPSSRPSSSLGESRPQQQQQPAQSQPQSQPVKTESSSNQAGPSSQRNREVTPPPIPRSKSPPPSTPSRSKLHALLRADGMMSPELARHLASNPVLRNLLKAVPSNSNALTALRNITGINKSPSANANGKGKRTTRNGGGLGGTGIGSDDKDNEGSPEATTPTPSHPPLPTPGRITRNMQDGCCNCGTMVSSCWRTKKMKDGTPRKVCDDCGLYFNEHKRMRPPELWSQPYKPGSSSTQPQHTQQSMHHPSGDLKRKHPHHDINDGPASGLRSSPRLNRTNSDKETHTIHSVSHHNQSHAQHQHQHQQHSNIPDSPRKRQKTKAPPPPSPRRATRASTRAGEGSGIDFGAEVFGFSPTNSTNSIFGTSPAIPINNNNNQQEFQSFGNAISSMSDSSSNQNQQYHNQNQNQNNGNSNNQHEEIDITAFLATFENSLTNSIDPNSNTNTNGNMNDSNNSNDNFSLDNLFNGIGDNMGVELSQEMQDLLNGWESQLNDPNYLGSLGDLSGLGGLGEIGNDSGNGNGNGVS